MENIATLFGLDEQTVVITWILKFRSLGCSSYSTTLKQIIMFVHRHFVKEGSE